MTSGYGLIRTLGEPGLGASKLGGLPDLPAGAAWPTLPHRGYERRALSLVLQVNLEEIEWDGPASGLLAVFCWWEDSEEFDGPDSHDVAAVVHVPRGAVLERSPPPSELIPGKVFTEHSVEVQPGGDRLLAAPRSIQDDVLEDLAAAATMSVRQRPEPGTPWQLLVQVDEADELGVTFGDGGRLYIGMPAADIAAARFDRVQAIVQMH